MDDYESLQRKQNVIVGVFVIIAACALSWLVYKFGDLPVIVSPYKSFELRIKFPLAPGVQENTPVRFCGFQVGRVIRVEPPRILEITDTNNWAYQTVVVVNVDNKYENMIPEDAQVKLMTRGFGSSYIEFKVKAFDVEQPTCACLSANSMLQGSTGITSEIFPEDTQKKLDQLVDGIKLFVDNANMIIGDGDNRENVKATLANLAELTGQAQQAAIELQGFLSAGKQTLDNVNNKINDISPVIVETGEELSKTLAEMRAVLEKINTGKGSAGRFLNDGKFYENLLENSQQLHALLAEMKEFVARSSKKGLPIKLK